MTPSLILAFGILSSSFVGSWHCGLMCGPIATYMKSRRALTSYHLGRLISYTALGALAGALGNFFLGHNFLVLRKLSALLLALTLFYTSLSLLFPARLGKVSPLSATIHRWVSRASAPMGPWLRRSGLVVGLLTAFLPCGWLYTYVAAATATQSAAAGSLVLILFWLGGLPAMSALPAAMGELLKATPQKRLRMAGVVLLMAALYSLWIFFF